MNGPIAHLIGLLDDGSAETAEDAKAELISIGTEAIAPLIAAALSLRRYGQLSAIEVFEQAGDVRAGTVLTQMLQSEHDTVREWAALALAHLEIRDAVPTLREAYDRFKASAMPLDVTEAVALRHALTVLGGRAEVVPALTASLQCAAGGLDQAWPTGRLPEVIADLAAHGQGVLYFQLWEVKEQGAFWRNHESLDRQWHDNRTWPELVAAARDAALLELACANIDGNVVATVEWINESDR